jgi:hypothetical protein
LNIILVAKEPEKVLVELDLFRECKLLCKNDGICRSRRRRT